VQGIVEITENRIESFVIKVGGITEQNIGKGKLG